MPPWHDQASHARAGEVLLFHVDRSLAPFHSRKTLFSSLFTTRRSPRTLPGTPCSTLAQLSESIPSLTGTSVSGDHQKRPALDPASKAFMMLHAMATGAVAVHEPLHGVSQSPKAQGKLPSGGQHTNSTIRES